MAVTHREEEVDSLASLEERISRAVEVVASLRQENQELASRLTTVEGELAQTQEKARASSARADELAAEIDGLRSERKHVRTRIEKLLGQMDLLTSS